MAKAPPNVVPKLVPTNKVPEALISPRLFTKNKPSLLAVEVATKIPSARRLEVVVPSVTVTAVVKAVVADPLVPSKPQENLPVVALYRTVSVSALQLEKPV